MPTESSLIKITSIENKGENISFFSEREINLNGSPERFLSEQISAENFRLRTSDNHYSSTWHVAGDPTLLIILTGIVRIELRSGETRDFKPGEMFIASDYLEKDVSFDDKKHGHRAEVVGDAELTAIHLKLEKRSI